MAIYLFIKLSFPRDDYHNRLKSYCRIDKILNVACCLGESYEKFETKIQSYAQKEKSYGQLSCPPFNNLKYREGFVII